MFLMVCLCLLALAACRHGEDLPVPSPEVETVQLIISVPNAAAGSRAIGDPGTAVDEGADWDRLAVILAYTGDSQVTLPGGSKVQVTTISKTEFEDLPDYANNSNNSKFKLLAIDAQPGTVYIYGVTYSYGEDNNQIYGNPESAIKACKKNDDVQALTISNDYASTSQNAASKFVSVATGYYKTTGNQPDEFTIQEGGTGQVGGIPTMTLTRLAAKIDIQWDAADAYEDGYTDVKVTEFTFYNDKVNTTVTDSGKGYLFPALNSSSTGIAGKKKFYNTSEISQRNGRVYHYTFPDGVSVPSVKFNITAEKEGNEITGDGYTLNFQKALNQAAWYKVNATIKGIRGSGTITFGDNSGSQVGG